nr:glycosyltransferase family 4 protein [uncultured Flavobacterium sp.]
MKYLICQEYTNTTDNHAGMKHMCNLLKKKYPDEYEVIIFPDLYKNLTKNKFVKKIQNFLIKKFLVPYKYFKIGKKLKNKITVEDSVFLLEYCELLFSQLFICKYLRKSVRNLKIYGLIHLVPEKLERSFSDRKLREWIEPLDRVITFGSSLTETLLKKYRIEDNKVVTLFHYVDLEYYKPLVKNQYSIKSKVPSVIVMGNQKRNFELLLEVVKKKPEFSFVICQGVMDLSEKFKECKNVELIGFINESQLLKLMQNSDISLNIMEDTIGSNVITTSMAVGLAMIVSNVGSIGDYCNNDGAMYCSNDVDSFSLALNTLRNNQEKLHKLQEKSILYSKNFSVHRLNDLISGL